jgi:hypothetical protein
LIWPSGDVAIAGVVGRRRDLREFRVAEVEQRVEVTVRVLGDLASRLLGLQPAVELRGVALEVGILDVAMLDLGEGAAFDEAVQEGLDRVRRFVVGPGRRAEGGKQQEGSARDAHQGSPWAVPSRVFSGSRRSCPP